MENKEMTLEQKARLVKFGHRVWKMLSPEEKDAYYCDTGTIGFVEDVVDMLHLSNCVVPLSEIEAIHNLIIR